MSDLNILAGTTGFTAVSEAGAGVLTIRGRLDFTTHQRAAEFFEQAFALFGPNLVVNLLEVDFLDSRATGLIVSCWRRAVDEGGRLALVAVERGSARVLWITGITTRVPVFPTVADALAAQAPPPPS
ncbi:anti-sigma factor antagonist [Sphaerisporangium album]|uniref:Anti-sigma factor antagonist n=1 Tax=Sphaerisporangium album TaxID=509200 RepID=A0A367F0Y9_9ACTN|nr:STAS domain-containing protein [Sphaerisporangium album]RCG24036.1 anti-sigma factor antagonist [Sphaerisporangium album]